MLMRLRLPSFVGKCVHAGFGAMVVVMIAASAAEAQVRTGAVPVIDGHGAIEGGAGKVLPPARYGELLAASGVGERVSTREGKSLGGALRMGLIGAAAGAVAGFGMEVVDPHGEIADIWPTLLAIPGFFVGVVYYGVR